MIIRYYEKIIDKVSNIIIKMTKYRENAEAVCNKGIPIII